MPLAESRRQQKASKTISIIAHLAFFTNSFLKPDRFCRIPMILWGLYAGLYLQKPIVWARLRSGVPFFGASRPFRRPFLRSISGGSHRPAHKNSRAFSSFLCTALAFFPQSCYTTHEVASFKPMLQVCICALLPMQPYTPHGDSNASSRVMVSPPSNDATLFLLRLADFCRAPVWCLQKVGALRQPWHRCFVRWTRSPRLPLTGTKNTLSAFAG